MTVRNDLDQHGRPSGGSVDALGLSIDWQQGPVIEVGGERPGNGALVETVIRAAKQRLEFFQLGQFACRENALAITKLDEALLWLAERTRRREAAGIEGTHQRDDTEGPIGS